MKLKQWGRNLVCWNLNLRSALARNIEYCRENLAGESGGGLKEVIFDFKKELGGNDRTLLTPSSKSMAKGIFICKYEGKFGILNNNSNDIQIYEQVFSM